MLFTNQSTVAIRVLKYAILSLYVLLPIMAFLGGIQYQQLVDSQRRSQSIPEFIPAVVSYPAVIPTTPIISPSVPETQPTLTCTTDADCMLVKDGWCGRVLAITKSSEESWKAQDIIDSQQKQQARQTCKVATAETLDINNYSAVCVESSCTAQPLTH